MSERKAATEGSDAPKEVQEPKGLDNDSDERPLEEHEQDASNETEGPSKLLFPGEEVERLRGANDKRHPGQEKDLWWTKGCKFAGQGDRKGDCEARTRDRRGEKFG